MNFTRTLGLVSAAAALTAFVACSSDDDDTNPTTGCDGGTCVPTTDAASADAAPASDASKLGQACTTSTDCSDGEQCGFKSSDGCGAAGTCVAETTSGSTCNAISLACACDGTEVNTICTGLPDGYVTQPIEFPVEMTCPDSGAAVDSGMTGTTDASTD